MNYPDTNKKFVETFFQNSYINKIKNCRNISEISKFEEDLVSQSNSKNLKLVKECLDYLRILKYQIKNCAETTMKETNSKFELFVKSLNEKSPPSGPAKRFSEDPKVKRSFKDRYGKDWKEVMYATAWKKFNKSESKTVGTPSNLEIGTDSLVNIYKSATPGQN